MRGEIAVVNVEFAEGVVSVAFDGVSGGIGEGDDVPVGVGKGVDFVQTDNSADKVVDVTETPNIVGCGMVFHNFLYTLPVTVVVKTTGFGGRGFRDTSVKGIVTIFCDKSSIGRCYANETVPRVVREVKVENPRHVAVTVGIMVHESV